MDKSNEINELAKALSSFQGQVQNVQKNKKGVYTYADIAQILDVVTPVLEKNNLCVTQPASSYIADGQLIVKVKTMLIHSSGQFISEEISMPIDMKQGRQMSHALGTAVTYLRRYSLASILNISQTDTDGIVPMPSPQPNSQYEPIQVVNNLASEKQVKMFYALIHKKNINQERIDNWLAAAKVKLIPELTKKQISALIDKLDKE